MEVCPVCSVRINNDTVLFSCGKPGTRQRLYARVCQFAKKEGCINKKIDTQTIRNSDYYGEIGE